MSTKPKKPAPPLFDRIRKILESARANVARTVNSTQVVANWLIGREIVEEEQRGKRRAGYGQQLVAQLSEALTAAYGRGWSVQSLFYMRQFYLSYPHLLAEGGILHAAGGELAESAILHAVRGESAVMPVPSVAGQPGQLNPNLSWTHYRTLLRVSRAEARAFYEIEAAQNCWSARELERQINSLLFDRLVKSRNKKGLMRLALEGQEVARPIDVLKDPMVLEFLDLPESPPVAEIVKKTVALLVEHTIDIPRISVVPKGPVKSGYKSFRLDVSKMSFQPQDMVLIGQGLRTGKQIQYGESSAVLENRMENYIVRELINYDDISYDDHADLIYALAGQAVENFRGYLKTEEELHNVLSSYGKNIADNIHLQMAQHYYEDISESEVVVSQGFTPLKLPAFTYVGEILPLHQAPDEKSKIAQYVYGGFAKCAYLEQKFHSDTERVLAGILERDARLWFRPVAGQFNIYYRAGVNQPEYVPDFVAATGDLNLIIETKAAKDMEIPEVKAKADAAVIWCKNASDYSRQHGGKPWKYLLVPHDVVASNATLDVLVRRFAL